MAVAFDAFTSNSGTFANSFTHTPSGTPRGILVFVHIGDAATTAVTYGGVSMSHVPDSPVSSTASVWLLGSSVPTGAQTVALTGPSANGVMVSVYSLTAAANVEWIDSVAWPTDTYANPSGTLSLGGRTSFAALFFGTDHDSVADVTPLANWTSRSEVTDSATFVNVSYSYNIIASTDITAGVTMASMTATGFAVAVSEVGATNASTSPTGAVATAGAGTAQVIATPPPPYTLTRVTG